MPTGAVGGLAPPPPPWLGDPAYTCLEAMFGHASGTFELRLSRRDGGPTTIHHYQSPQGLTLAAEFALSRSRWNRVSVGTLVRHHGHVHRLAAPFLACHLRAVDGTSGETRTMRGLGELARQGWPPTLVARLPGGDRLAVWTFSQPVYLDDPQRRDAVYRANLALCARIVHPDAIAGAGVIPVELPLPGVVRPTASDGRAMNSVGPVSYRVYHLHDFSELVRSAGSLPRGRATTPGGGA